MWTSPYRIYTNEKQTKILDAKDPDAVLLCGEWDRIPVETARKLGLVDKDGNTHSPQSIKAQHTRTVKEATDG
jgi:hypothetical protein